MTTIQVRDVPEETARVLKVRAARAGQSLQEYLRLHLVEFAGRPTMDEWLAELPLDGGTEITVSEILDAIHEGRREE